jgi:REP element-mobilizing transposase RayT
MAQEPYHLDRRRRALVLEAIVDCCARRTWTMLAAHVRTSHVHIVVEAGDRPENVMNALKAYASRRLNQTGWDAPDRRHWSRHGSTRYLWKREHMEKAIAYVADSQGEPMALHLNQGR